VGEYMLYEEFNQYKSSINKINPLCHYYEDGNGNSFFVEPGFYTALLGYKDKDPKNFTRIMERIDFEIKRNHKVVFVSDYENPFVSIDDYIFLEMTDITDPLHCTWVDDSRPSDYGD